jgi:hypothetical protein
VPADFGTGYPGVLNVVEQAQVDIRFSERFDSAHKRAQQAVHQSKHPEVVRMGSQEQEHLVQANQRLRVFELPARNLLQQPGYALSAPVVEGMLQPLQL